MGQGKKGLPSKQAGGLPRSDWPAHKLMHVQCCLGCISHAKKERGFYLSGDTKTSGLKPVRLGLVRARQILITLHLQQSAGGALKFKI